MQLTDKQKEVLLRMVIDEEERSIASSNTERVGLLREIKDQLISRPRETRTLKEKSDALAGE